MARKIGAVIALDGEQKFKNAVTACTKSLNSMKSELKMVETQMSGQKNSLEALQKKHAALNNVLDASKVKEQAIQKELDEAKKKYENIGSKLGDYKTNLSEATEKLDQMKSSGTATKEELEKQETAVKNAADAVERAERSYESAGNKAEDWQRRLYDARTETSKAEQAVKENADAMTELESKTNGASDELDEFGDEAKEAAGKSGELDISLKSLVKNAAVNLATDALREIAQKAGEAAKYVVEVGSSFEASMSKVEALSGASKSQLSQMSQAAQELGRTTRFSATEVADGFSYMSLAGWKTEEMLSAIDGVVNLAAASEMDLAEASDMVTDYLSAFGLEASDAGKMVDEMAYAQANSNTTTTQLGEAFGNCAANMHASGQSMETTTALLEALANQGKKGSEAGTALAAIMRDITAKMEDGAIKIGDTSVAVTDANGNFRDMTDILADIDTATQGMGDAEKAAAISTTFTRNSVSGLNMILNEGVDNVKGYKEALEAADGTAASMAATMQDNLQGKLTAFGSAVEGLGIAVYNKVAEPLTGAVEFMTGVVSGLTSALTPAKTDLETFLDDVKESNKEVEASLKNAEQTVSNAEAKAAELTVYGEEFDDILGKCEEFNLVTLDDGEQAIVDSSGNIVKKLGEVGTEAEDVEKALRTFGEEGLNTANVQASAEELRGMIGYVKTDVDELGNSIGQTYVITDEFTKAKISAMVDALGDSVGDLSTAWDEQTGELKTSKEALDKWFGTAKDVAMYTALQDAVQDLYSAWGDAALNLVKANSGLDASKEALDKWLESVGMSQTEVEKQGKKLGALYDEYLKLKQGVNEASGEVEKSEELLSTCEEEIATTGEKLTELKDAYDNATQSTKDNTEATEGATDAQGDLKNAEDDAANAVQSAVDALKEQHQHLADLRTITQEAAQEIKESFAETKESAESAFSLDPFGEWGKNAENGMAKFQESMQSQIDGMLAYRDNIVTVKDNLGKTSPEFVQYLQDMGVGGAQLVEDLAEAFRNGDTEAVNALVAQYEEALDIQDSVTDILAQDKFALQLGLAGLTEEAILEWDNLGMAFDTGVAVIQEKGGTLAEETRTSFWQAVEAAKAVGLEVPAGLADEILNSDKPEIAIQQATEKIQAKIQGRGEGLLDAARELGVNVPDGIVESITTGTGDVDQSVADLVQLIKDKKSDFDEAGATAGEGMGKSAASGITSKERDVSNAADDVVGAAKDSAATASELFSLVGGSAMEAMKVGFAEKQEGVSTNLKAHLTVIKNQAKTKAEEIYDEIGESMVSTIADGFDDTSKITSAIDTLNTEVSSKMDTLVSTVQNAMDNIKNATNFSWQLPHLPLPHVVTGWDTITYGDGAWVQIPRFSVNWYAKAMANGMILDSPTIFGMQNGNLLGAGEAGSETVVGTTSLMSMIQSAVNDSMAGPGDSGIHGTNDRLDALISILGDYIPQILDASKGGKVFDISNNYMGILSQRTSETIGQNVRRSR